MPRTEIIWQRDVPRYVDGLLSMGYENLSGGVNVFNENPALGYDECFGGEYIKPNLERCRIYSAAMPDDSNMYTSVKVVHDTVTEDEYMIRKAGIAHYNNCIWGLTRRLDGDW